MTLTQFAVLLLAASVGIHTLHLRSVNQTVRSLHRRLTELENWTRKNGEREP